MKILKICSLFSLLFLLFACNNNDDEITTIPENEYTIDIGSYELLPESITAFPYSDKNGAQFVDSLGNELILVIDEGLSVNDFGKNALIKYDVYDLGDTVRYEYDSQNIYGILKNDSLGIWFHTSLKARPYYPDPESAAVADVMEVFLRSNEDILLSSQVFYHVLAQRSWPDAVGGNSENLGEVEFFGKTFSDVFYIPFIDPLSKVFFNYDFGIISFTDFSGKTWRFEAFIE